MFVCRGEGSLVFVCSIFQAGGLHTCSSVRTKSGLVCVNMSPNVCACVRPVVQCECTP